MSFFLKRAVDDAIDRLGQLANQLSPQTKGRRLQRHANRRHRQTGDAKIRWSSSSDRIVAVARVPQSKFQATPK